MAETLYLARDAASRRTVDVNGFLHVADNPVSRVQVAPYYGQEIPGCEDLGLDPQALYHLLRPADELRRAAPTINGLPIELMHHDTAAANLPKAEIIGSTGTDGRFDGVYLRNSLHITDADAIARITAADPDERLVELSLAYFYEPDMTPGEYQGQPYDGVMRNIRGNHLALVDQGRAGPSVAVADRHPNPNPQRSGIMGKIGKIFGARRLARDDDPRVEQQEVESASAIKEEADLILSLHTIDPATREVVDVTEDEDKDAAIKRIVDGLAARMDLTPEAVKQLTDSLTDLAYSQATGDEDPAAADDPRDDLKTDAEKRAFEMGVRYGEKREKADPERLDREHESEGARGDEDPAADDDEPRDALKTDAEKRAFEMGVRYGEKREKADPERLDREHESEGARRAMDRRFLRSPAKAAADAALTRIQAVMDAAREVRPVVGDLNVNVAKDSAQTIYARALRVMGVDTRGMAPGSYRDVYRVAAESRLGQGAGMVNPARDAAPARLDGPFAHLKNIHIS